MTDFSRLPELPERMSAREFKYGLLSLADDRPALISEKVIARYLAAAYIDADPETQADCSRMLREDLARAANRGE